MKKTLITIGVSLVAILLVIWMFGSIQRSNLEKAAELEREEAFQRSLQLDSCTASAYDVYDQNWDSSCAIEGRGPDCQLPMYRATELNADYERDKDRCVELYK